ncbi:ornithine cyclodeaminase family protein [Haloferax mediterranei ATCC 33500]|uniref:Ornithine cyclodeaminase n=1 Tax=Haloferax mediterranei (strain ATCC 33500 / DSM 1411 / JCM 8866 / NBRC 14739 / NCIMB 2177 / R-4) TaxID=523841 RepID=I3R8P8_HALMT|nr:ornithine cyclodeaminase family protein [Haloferax mediterranei]AFK20608.1 ornithine cyclodeaminase [Haloferax mediterranei ATCC 33500]AHZ22907.1 ornithine cyclodeaminase [Haloferax mediterranei ATCC 33500]EMA03074.1 ornithine cyclodeaminase [Haloferax mediterranei ATCC 33500]MDX5987746.1 ornithine cyclodeaminase family protein [Haloferax mediterranei ATCC 33500]QCQ74226.1 ornithine cyclodeaminase family protein [Haloferax mediterranei ATCC 33500]
MVQILSADDVRGLLSLPELFPVVEEAFVKQGHDEVERPSRPHFPVGIGIDGGTGDVDAVEHDHRPPLGTALTMPAYIHGHEVYATKLAAVHAANAARGLQTVNAQVVLNDARTGLSLAFLDGTTITNARTGCVGGLAATYLSTGPVHLGVLGAGTQARWQTRAIAAATDVESVRIYSPTVSRERCAADLRDDGIDAEAVSSPKIAVSESTVVVTATTSTEPAFAAEWLNPGTLVIAIGAYTGEMQELGPATFDRASRVFADVPEEVADIGDVRESGLTESDLIPLSGVFEGGVGRDSDDEILIVESVGSAVLDAATAEYLYEKSIENGVGEDVEL